MADDAGHGVDDRPRPEGGEREFRVLEPRDTKARRTPDDPPQHHSSEQAHIKIGRAFGQQPVQRPRAGAVGRQLKGHGDAGEDRGHTEQCGAQQRRHKANRQSPGPAADETAQQHGDMHGTQGTANLGDLPGEEGQRQGQRQKHAGKGQASDLDVDGMFLFHKTSLHQKKALLFLHEKTMPS